MKKIIKILSLSIFAFLQLNIHAQISVEEQLAIQFYQNKEYDKALDYYEKLYNKKSTEQFYLNYFNCLIQLKDFKKAEKIVKKQIKQNIEKTEFYVDLGIVYTYTNDADKAKNTWEQGIKSSKSDEQILPLAKAFIAIKEYEYAIKSYLKGRKTSINNYPYSFELADIYSITGDKIAMINEYLDVLEIQDSYIQSVQNSLQTSFGNDADIKQNEILKNELLKRIAKKPDKIILSELLIWMQIQQKDFGGAFLQAKAIDKRKKEEGGRLIGLAQLSAENDNYDIAIKAYEYVIAKGVANSLYKQARTELLDLYYKKIVLNGNYNTTDLLELEKNLNVAIIELGLDASSAKISSIDGSSSMIKNLAHLKAFYLDKTNEAIELLEKTILVTSVNSQMQAVFKLELADILLMSGDIWEASLRYSQVEKSYKYDIIGQEAKFRNAKISYYTGDFVWAQAQLDVLKGATAKLIANDAMDLSLLISDALAIDTNIAPLMIFSRADLLAFQNKDEQAKTTLDSINTLFPNHALADNVFYQKAKIEFKHSNYIKVAEFYDTIIKYYGEDILGDDALFKLAELNQYQIKNTIKAKDLYQELIIKYPGSLYVVEARKQFRKLRGDSFN